jgi:serine/threonine protein kinase
MSNSQQQQQKAAPQKKKLTHIGQYEIGRTLGEGSFSKVKLATDVFTGKKVSAIDRSVSGKLEGKRDRKKKKKFVFLFLSLSFSFSVFLSFFLSSTLHHFIIFLTSFFPFFSS